MSISIPIDNRFYESNRLYDDLLFFSKQNNIEFETLLACTNILMNWGYKRKDIISQIEKYYDIYGENILVNLQVKAMVKKEQKIDKNNI